METNGVAVPRGNPQAVAAGVGAMLEMAMGSAPDMARRGLSAICRRMARVAWYVPERTNAIPG